MDSKYFENLFNLVEKDSFEAIFKELDNIKIPSNLEIEISAIKARFNDYKQAKILGTLTHEQSIVDKNIIRENILFFINNLRANLNSKVQNIGKRLTFIPRPPQGFVGRKKDIETIHELLQTNRPVLLLVGIGGIGKTTITSKYIQNYFSDYDHFVWVNVPRDPDKEQSTQPTTKSVIANDTLNFLSQNLHFEYDPKLSEEIKFKLVMEKLKEIPGENLLIIDNAGSEILQIRDSLPSPPNWRILIISREYINSFIPYRLDVLSPDDAKDLFLTHHPSGKNEIDTVNALIAKIGFHTLTLELLAKFCEIELSSHPVLDIFNKIIDHKFHTLSEEIWTNHSNKEVDLYAYLLSAFNHSSLAKNECDILSQWALLPSEEIEADLLLKIFAIGKNNIDQFRKSIFQLVRKGWLLKHPETGTYRCHQMIQEVIHYKLPPSIKICQPIILGLTNLLTYNIYENNLLRAKYIPWVEGLIEGLKDPIINSDLGKLYNSLAAIKKDIGDYFNAESIQVRAIEIFNNLKESNTSNLVSAYRNMALILRSQGNYSASHKYQRKAIEILQKSQNHDQHALAKLYSDMALILRNLGRYKEAKNIQLKGISIFEDLSEFNHPDLAIAYSIMATILQDLGFYKEAEKFQTKAIQIREKVYDGMHPFLATSYHTMSLIFLNLNNYHKAEEFQVKAIEIREEILDFKHPNLASSYSGMASILMEQGNLSLAQNFQQKAIKIQEEVLGDMHPSLARSYDNLAMIFCKNGDFPNSLIFQKKAIKIKEAKLNPIHPQLGLSYYGMAIIHKEMKENLKAKNYIKKTIEIFESALDFNHPYLIKTYNLAVSNLHDLGMTDEANLVLRKIKRIK